MRCCARIPRLVRIIRLFRSADEIVAGLAELGVSARRIRIPEVDIKTVREAQNLSQPEFATLYGLDVNTLRNWEQGRNVPDRSTTVLLKIIDTNPDAVLQALTAEPNGSAR